MTTKQKILCHTIIIRALLWPKWVNKLTGNVTKHAFIPRPNGKDKDGLSIQILNDFNLSSSSSRKQITNLSRNFSNTVGTASLHIGLIRDYESSIYSGLDVIPLPSPNNPDHGGITGLPAISKIPYDVTNPLNREIEHKAKYLANISRYIS